MNNEEPNSPFWGIFQKLGRIPNASMRTSGIYDGFYASLYDGTTHPYTDDLLDYFQAAGTHNGPILDVGCGTGRILARLAEKGYAVTGIDTSDDMLAHAVRHVSELPADARDRVRLIKQDARSFEFDARFSQIIISAFTFLVNPSDRLECLKSARRHLYDDGCVTLDFLLFTEENIAAIDGAVSCVDVPIPEGAMFILAGTKFNQQRTAWWWNFYTQHLNDAGTSESYLGGTEFARIDPAELEALLEEAGFAVAERRDYSQPMLQTVATRTFYRAIPRVGIRYPLWHPYVPMNNVESEKIVLVSGSGCTVRDDKGKQYIDASGGLWSTQCGLGNPEIIEAVHQQLQRLSYGTLFALRSNEPAIELSRKLTEMVGGSLTRAYLTCSGSESVEFAIKLARLYFHVRGFPERTEIVYLDQSYHGTYYGSVGVTGLVRDKERIGPHVPGLSAIGSPVPSGGPQNALGLDCELSSAAQLEDRIVSGGKVAAFILEPILGSAGVVVPTPAYFDAVKSICRKHGVLLILDEVATGFGRTGRWFAFEHFGFRPDILLLSKGINSGYLPLGAVLFSERIAQTLLAKGAGICHGSSANGNPACCAAALATIGVIERDGLVERSARMGAYFQQRLESLRRHRSVKDIRGLGLMRAVEFSQIIDGRSHAISPAQLAAIYSSMTAKGVLPYGFASGLSFLPALTIAPEEIDYIVRSLDETLSVMDLRDDSVIPRAVPVN